MSVVNLDLRDLTLKRVLPVGMAGIMAASFVGCGKTKSEVPTNMESVVVSQADLTKEEASFTEKYEKDKDEFKKICQKHFGDSFYVLKATLIETNKGEKTTLRLVNVSDYSIGKLNEFLDDVNSKFNYSSFMTDETVIKNINNLNVKVNDIKELTVDDDTNEKLNLSRFKAVEVLDLTNAHALLKNLTNLKTLIISSTSRNERYDQELTSLPNTIENIYIANANIDGAVISCKFCSLYYDEKSADNIPESDVTFIDTSILHINSLGPTVNVKGNIKKEIRGKGNINIKELDNCTPYININGEKVEETTKEVTK